MRDPLIGVPPRRRLGLVLGLVLVAATGGNAVARPAAVPAARPDSEAKEGERLRRSGQYAQARTLLEETVRRDPTALAARHELGLVYRLTGEAQLERRIWNQFFDDYETKQIDRKSARELTWVALAARYLESWKDANDLFREAVEAESQGQGGGARQHRVGGAVPGEVRRGSRRAVARRGAQDCAR